ncbi:potassium transporter Kup [bacterium]|nr:potassium transporter Kup [bacterium]
MNKNSNTDKFSLAGALVTLGIVFGDLGTSPLYTMRAITQGGAGEFSQILVFGGLSCVFWTLTLIATVKYVIITLRADNKGEGGIFALAALIRRKSPAIAVLTMIGGAAILADGVITPAITVTSSIEGLKLYNPEIPVVLIVLGILAFMFFIQQFGTNLIGKSFGPVMLIWFMVLSILGLAQIIQYPAILKALNPLYAYRFLIEYPDGFVLLGAVFLCTTGVEALYADLGHCGRNNIRVSWGFVKTALVLNYFGQGAWLMMHTEGSQEVNPFFAVMPEWFLGPGIFLATAAAIIASQAMISGSFTLLSEAISLNFWPKLKVMHPSLLRGQVYLPAVNWFLWLACSLTVILFEESANMEAAYGLSINLTMISTTLLLTNYLIQRRGSRFLIFSLLFVYLAIEGGFLVSNLHKFIHGGWYTLLLAVLFSLIMYGWYFGRKLRNRHITFAYLDGYLDMFRDLAADKTVPLYATNLVYIIHANSINQVESKVIYSIFNKQPKRAKTYWLLHVDMVDEPNRFEYKVTHIAKGLVIRIDFHLGYKVEPKINLYFREAVEDLVKSGEIRLESGFPSLKKRGFQGDFRFVLIERIMLNDFKLSTVDSFTISLYSVVKRLSIPPDRVFNLDNTSIVVEKVPIMIDQPVGSRIMRI